MADRQSAVNAQNVEFWNELCGSYDARRLGVYDNDPASLKRYDDWYFSFYHYLASYIDFATLKNRDVLEVGLGYGSVSQRIAASGAQYVGLDIARGPVDGVNHRLRCNALRGEARLGSILAAPFPDQSFDIAIAIGSLHHTGDLALALKEIDRLLRPNGRAIIMVYNALSYARLSKHPMQSIGTIFRGIERLDTDKQRGRFDFNSEGVGAPETALVTRGHLSKMLAPYFKDIEITAENVGSPIPFISRRMMCRLFGEHFGLDLYAKVSK